ncbi:hypothetical protein [Adlercreutzia equolifaciens]|uniref:hypothetical protein n=1 Tax=Adlercreutzia equolifaciens TaxID=446660 RepID=UPI0022DFE9B0|nr:hypothetical protein [Adlercreutzia equolifaciens]
MSSEQNEGQATDERAGIEWWKGAAIAACSLLIVVAAVLGCLALLFAGSCWLSAERDCLVRLASILIVAVGLVVIAFAIFVLGGVLSEGKSDGKTFRENALSVAQLLAVMLTAIGMISGLLLVVLKVGF